MEKILQDISFIDEKEYIHKIDIANMIGSGAQGMVFRGENKNILIKISQVKKENDFGRKIDKIKSLNLSKDFKFATNITIKKQEV